MALIYNVTIEPADKEGVFHITWQKKAKAYLEQAYAIFEKFFGPEHPRSKTTAGWLEECR